MCAGLYLARMEMEVMLEALVENGATPRTGAPVIGANKGLYPIPERVTLALSRC
jgi:cytochrome P450